MKRIAIVGVTGSGKSTLANMLEAQCGIPHIELDALYWGPNWTPPASRELFCQRVAEVLQGETWVTSGNYSSARKVVWARADTLIWLDYSLNLVLPRLLKRSVRRIVSQEELWNGNRETFRAQFASRDSLFVWLLKTHSRLRRDYPILLEQEEYRHLQVIRLRNPQATEQWLSTCGAN